MCSEWGEENRARVAGWISAAGTFNRGERRGAPFLFAPACKQTVENGNEPLHMEQLFGPVGGEGADEASFSFPSVPFV